MMSNFFSSFLVFFILLIGPAIVALVVKVRQVQRETREAEIEAKPFTPEEEPAPGWFLRRFSLGERTFLRQQTGAYWFGLIYLTWVLMLLFSMPVLVTLPSPRGWHDLSALAWYRYLDNAGGTFLRMSGTLCFLSAFGAVSAIRVKAVAQFYRTRPLAMGLLFWGKVLPLLGAVVVSVATASLLSLAVFYVAKGPVWQHLPAVFPGTLDADDDLGERYKALLATSAPRVFLSLVTSFALIVSVSVGVGSIPMPRWVRQRPAPVVLIPVMMLALLGMVVFNFVDAIGIMRIPKALFIYSRLGPPPPYGLVVVPILLSAGALLLARWMISRTEI